MPVSDSNPIYVGIDPGLGITGYGVVESEPSGTKLIEAGCIRTIAKNPLELRLKELYDGLTGVFSEFKPETVIIEDLYSHYRHPRTAIIMGHARGVIFLSASSVSVPVQSYGATMIKKSLTGNGRASKKQVQMMIKSKLGMPEIPEPADVADALAAALCHINHLQGKSQFQEQTV